MEDKYLLHLKKLVLSALCHEPLKVVLFGSRARGDYHSGSDIDIGILPRGKIDEKKISLLREQIDHSNIPYKVEVVNLAETSLTFRQQALKRAIVWKK